MKDCVVVGGGPAGLTAALYLARFLRSVTVFDAGDGRARMIPRTHNLGPFPDGISGSDLLDRMRSHVERYGAAIETGTVGAVEKQGELFRVTTDRRVETARNVIFATGVFNHRPPLSVEEHDRGLARGLIRYCPVCDAYEVRGKRIAVLGSGVHGHEEATFVRGYSASVSLIPIDGSVAAGGDGVGVLESPMVGLALSETQVLVTLKNGETRSFDTLYAALGTRVRTELAAKLGVRLAEGGCVFVDADQRTSVDGVYAVGDVTERLDQIAVAMAHGAVAATAIHNDLPGTVPGPG
jgi:thioredoxin reductase (NADPH)